MSSSSSSSSRPSPFLFDAFDLSFALELDLLAPHLLLDFALPFALAIAGAFFIDFLVLVHVLVLVVFGFFSLAGLELEDAADLALGLGFAFAAAAWRRGGIVTYDYLMFLFSISLVSLSTFEFDSKYVHIVLVSK